MLHTDTNRNAAPPHGRSTVVVLWSLLTGAQRVAASRLIGLMLAGTLLETLGIGLLLPALALMTQPESLKRYVFFRPLGSGFVTLSQTQLIVDGMLALVTVYLLKAVLLMLLAWRQGAFIASLHADLSRRLFAEYLRQPYSFHLQRNSTQLVHSVNQVRDVTNAVQSTLVIIVESLIMVALTALLLWVEPVGAVVVGTALGLAVWLLNRLTRRRILGWSTDRHRHDRLRVQHLNHGLGGVKELKLLGREAGFLDQYHAHSTKSAQAGELQETALALPRILLEFFTVAGLALLVIIMVALGRPLNSLLPAMTVFAAASFRTMPSVGRLLSAAQRLTSYAPVVASRGIELRAAQSAPVAVRRQPMPFAESIELIDVAFRYPGAGPVVLRDLNARIPRGAVVGIIGESGAGKSTMIDLVLGLLSPSAGHILVDGRDIGEDLPGWQSQIGYVPQAIFLSDESLRRNIAFGVSETDIDDAAVWRSVRAASLGALVDQLPDGLNTIIGERGIALSGGQRQRIGIARALYHDPTVLVFDEATNALDEITEDGVLEAIRALGGTRTVFIVTHRSSTIRICDVVYQLARGTVTRRLAPSPALVGADT